MRIRIRDLLNPRSGTRDGRNWIRDSGFATRAAILETLALARTLGDVNISKNILSSRYASSNRDHNNICDPRKAKGSNNIGHSRVKCNCIVNSIGSRA